MKLITQPENLLIWNYTNISPEKIGGVEKHILGLSQAFKLKGISTYESTEPPALKDNYAFLVLHSHGDVWATPKTIKNIRVLKNKVKFIWIHIAHGNTVARIIAGREYLSVSGWKGALRDQTLMMASDACVAVSPHARDELQKYHRYSKPCVVIENGVDENTFTPITKITTKPHVLFLGRSEDRVKNSKLFLMAMDAVYQHINDIEVRVAPGLREMRPYIKNIGNLNPTGVANQLRDSKILVLSSFYEGDPLVIREAMASGIYIVATDLPATRYMLKDYPNKSLIQVKNASALSEEVLKVLRNTNLLPTPQLRSWTAVAEDYLTSYENLFQGLIR